jgi:UDP-N-acetylmuramate: L-alanyl-gamma-D-glutamyl-meso-diaminopimelate ligase
MAHYESAFEKFCATMPANGLLAVSASYPRAVEMARRLSKAKVVTYAVNGKADYRADNEIFSPEGVTFRMYARRAKATELRLPMSGYHNVENAAGVYAAARALGLSHQEIARGFRTFKGVKRRQEERGEIGGVLVVDDFAHHPTAVRETIEGIRQRYPDRRLWAVFEPRSNTSRRNIHQREYAASFVGADLATIREPEPHDKVPADQQLNVAAIVGELNRQGITADSSADVAELVRRVGLGAREGDLILVMSNGSFGGFIPSLMAALEERFGAARSG